MRTHLTAVGIGDVVMGMFVGREFIGRVITIGGGGLTEILRDDGHLEFIYTGTRLDVIQKYDGPPDLIDELPCGGRALRRSILEVHT